MKFDFVIGNPPYQETTKDTSDKPIYNLFMDAAFGVSDNVTLIHPARFLFNAGKTPKDWNNRMLQDTHFKVLDYQQDSSVVFANTDIKGGVAITHRDAKKEYGAIGLFSPFRELNQIVNKVKATSFTPLSGMVYAPESYKFTDVLHEENPSAIISMSKGHSNDVTTNIFDKLSDIFYQNCPSDDKTYIRIIGRSGNERVVRWVKKDYICTHPNLEKWKVILPKSNGSGAIGEVLSTPLIGEPLIGHTQTFISIGTFDSRSEAEALFKYIKTKFCRVLLGVLKITQDNKKETWRMVPLQDFTTSSDIDWSKSIAEIDRQLYAKYGLDENEINFIETKVKEMQ